MNHYDEFGLTPSASSEEIRRTYRAVSRLLHPDTHSDERLKALADFQMKRANEVFALLLDPERRRAYDAAVLPRLELSPLPAPYWPRSEGWASHINLGHGFWLLIAVMIVASFVWYVRAGWSDPAMIAPVADAAPALPPETDSSIAGTWFHYPGTGDADSFAPPDAVLRVNATGQIIEGNYEERSSPADRPVLAPLTLRLQGQFAGSRSANLAWSADDGSRGEMDLYMQTPSMIRATWWTTKLGRRARAASGASLLTRQPLP